MAEDIGKLVLRVTLAVLLLFHGIDKIGHLSGIIAILGKKDSLNFSLI